jgi:hypothetical protein
MFTLGAMLQIIDYYLLYLSKNPIIKLIFFFGTVRICEIPPV